jgi:hypothetical protein
VAAGEQGLAQRTADESAAAEHRDVHADTFRHWRADADRRFTRRPPALPLLKGSADPFHAAFAG